MKKIMFISVFLIATCCYGQQFTSLPIIQDGEKWERIHNEFGQNMSKYAQAFLDSNICRLNLEGGLEYEYIIYSSDTLDLVKIKELTIDFIGKNFNLSNNDRATLIQGCTERSVYFKGHYGNLAFYRKTFGGNRYYDADVIFIFKFKENRIKINITVPYLVYHVGNSQERVYFKYRYLMSADSMDIYGADWALTNTTSQTMAYPLAYMLYLNDNYKPVALSEEDW